MKGSVSLDLGDCRFAVRGFVAVAAEEEGEESGFAVCTGGVVGRETAASCTGGLHDGVLVV
jgi:hypothetical protein